MTEEKWDAGEGITLEGAESRVIDLTPHLKFKRIEGEAYTFRGTRDGLEVVHVFEPGEPMVIAGGQYTFVSLFRGRLPEGDNLLPAGSHITPKE